MPKALIVWGGWEGHQPEKGAHLVAEMLANDGFDVHVTSDYGAFGAPDLADNNLVVPIITSDQIDRALIKSLVAAVRGGVGLGSYHGGIATSFRDMVEFHYMAGVQWVAHPGDIVDFTVDVEKPDDPVMEGISGFAYRSEQYYLHFDPSIEILASTTFTGEHDPVTSGVKMPVVFKRRFGRGRVFYTALGHVVDEFAHKPMRTILRRGLHWAAGRDDARFPVQ